MERTIARALVVLAIVGAAGGVFLAANHEDGPRCSVIETPAGAPDVVPSDMGDLRTPTEMCVYEQGEFTLPPFPQPTFDLPEAELRRVGP